MYHAADQMVAMSHFSAVRRIVSVWISMEKRFLKVENLPRTPQTAPSLSIHQQSVSKGIRKQSPNVCIQEVERSLGVDQMEHTMKSSVVQVVIAGVVTAPDRCMA